MKIGKPAVTAKACFRIIAFRNSVCQHCEETFKKLTGKRSREELCVGYESELTCDVRREDHFDGVDVT